MITATTLGTSGLRSTSVAIGTAALGRPGYLTLGHGRDLDGRRDVAAMRRHAHEVLDVAHRHGVRHVDCARSYGRAEEFVAAWLDARGHDDVLVSSKWGYTYTAGWRVDADEHEVKDHSLATLRRQRAETAALLGDRLGLYQVHSAALDTGVLDDHDVLAALSSLADEGVAVGLSTSGPGQAATIERALARAAAGDAPFTCVQVTWNLLEQSAGDALRAAHDAGWGVIVKEALANGRLTDRGDPPHGLRVAADRHDVGVDAVALAAVLAQPFVDVVLSGATTIDQLRSNLAATRVTVDDDLAALLSTPEPADAYWATRARLAWT